MSTKSAPSPTEVQPVEPELSSAGVDLTQIRALKALTPTERARALATAANNLLRLKKNVRRV